jgi:rRNA processing protein Krr1/Pno1
MLEFPKERIPLIVEELKKSVDLIDGYDTVHIEIDIKGSSIKLKVMVSPETKK